MTFAVPFPYPDDVDLDLDRRLYRWVSHKAHWKWEEARPNSNLFKPIGERTAHSMGYEKPAVSIYFHNELVATGTDPLDQASSPHMGIVWLTVEQIRSVSGIGIHFDAHAHPAHGLLFRIGETPKLDADQRRDLHNIIMENDQILKQPTRET